MKLNSRIRRGGIMLAVAIVSLVYYGIVILKEIHNRRRPAPPTEYYGLAAGTIPSQWGRRSQSTVCGPGGCSTSTAETANDDTGDRGTWVIYSDCWVFKRSGFEVGRINRDGTTTGFVEAQPGWYPSGMPQQFQAALSQRTTGGGRVGDLPPAGTTSVGQLPPTGVDKEKVADDKARIPGGVSINGVPETEALVRNRLSDSAKSQGLKDYGESFRLVIVGHEKERQPFIAVAKSTADQSNERLIIQEYEEEDWQIKAHANAAKSLPEYQAGKPFAFLQRSTGAVKAIMYTPGEVAQVIKQARPEVAPNFDAAKARALTQASNDWLIWASAAFVAVCGLIGAVTSKS